MISNIQNPWLKKKDKISSEKMKEMQLAMAKKAKEILSDEKFIEYKKMYELYHAYEVDNLLMLKCDDPIQYAFKVRQVVDTLKAYRLLISSIEEDAARLSQEVES